MWTAPSLRLNKEFSRLTAGPQVTAVSVISFPNWETGSKLNHHGDTTITDHKTNLYIQPSSIICRNRGLYTRWALLGLCCECIVSNSSHPQWKIVLDKDKEVCKRSHHPETKCLPWHLIDFKENSKVLFYFVSSFHVWLNGLILCPFFKCQSW